MPWRAMLVSAGVLALFALVGTVLVAGTYSGTRERIEFNRRAALEAALHELVPAHRYSNDPLTDTVLRRDREALGSDEPVVFYRAFDGASPVALFATPVAPDGYGGAIELLVGVYADGSVAGVRVLAHRETPGLGDKIEIDRSDWIRSFDGTSLQAPPESRWSVRKDGGDFDQFTGATITPRAVVGAVHRLLVYIRTHREGLFADESS